MVRLQHPRTFGPRRRLAFGALARLALLLLAVTLGSCANLTGGCIGLGCTVAGRLDIDNASYQLSGNSSAGYAIHINATYTNTGARTLYLARTCGDGSTPDMRPARLAGDTTPSSLDFPTVCITIGRLKWPSPIALAPGKSLTWGTTLRTLGQSSAPTTPTASLAGTFFLVARVQTNGEAPPAASDLIPMEFRTSASFTVLPPTP